MRSDGRSSGSLGSIHEEKCCLREELLPPAADAMLESLRALGYSFEAALADIIDNSIAAGARRVAVEFRAQPKLYVAIVDDGAGMDADELREAMRHGGIGPRRVRSASDLGRFGLGLKTASLSQCRRLTVVSVQRGHMVGARWDLDRIEETGDWVLGILAAEDFAGVPHIDDLAAKEHGTIVVWEDFDRATAGEAKPADALGTLVDASRDHLALVYHRLLAPRPGKPPEIELAINKAAVAALDPYLVEHRGTQALPVEKIRIDGSDVILRPYVLPHISRMSKADLALAGGEDGLRRNQGFYVYRNRRLITYGTWFRLLRQEELTKLARVQVDIPNSLDHLWALDVKKSRAFPPEGVRTALLRVVERIAGTSRHVYRFRGRRAQSDVTHIWDRLVLRDGIAYRLNRHHPLAASALDSLNPSRDIMLEQLLKAIELSLPTDAIYADMASERRVQASGTDPETKAFLAEIAQRMVDSLADDRASMERLLDSLSQIEPFSSYPTAARSAIEELRSGR
jgi:hypothetical protein